MKPLALNISKMKKIAGDKNSSTFQHPDGHHIKIAHAGVSALQRKQLEKMQVHKFANGGNSSDNTIDYDTLIPQEQAENAPYGTAQMPQNNTQQEVQDNPSQAQDQSDDSDRSPAALPPALSVGPGDSAYEQAEKAMLGGANAEAAAANQTSDAYQDYLNKTKNLPTPNDIAQQYKAKDDALMHAYMSNQVDPNHYWASKSTGAKIAGAIGLLFGGIGAAKTGGPNYAQQNINSAINQDIEAQKNSQDKSLNLWKLNRQAMGSDIEANLATQNQYLSAVDAQARQYAAKAGGPEALAKVAPQLLQLEQQRAQNRALLGLMQGGPSGQGDEQSHVNTMNAMQQLRPDVYKDMQSKYIPGVGVARIPVQEKNKEALTKYQQLNSQIDDAIHFAKTVGTTVPGSTNNAIANSKANSIVLSLNDLHGLNRLNDNEFETYKDQVGNPGALRTGKAIGQLQELKHQIGLRATGEMGSLGVIPFKNSMNAQIQEPQIKVVNGVKYMRGPNGQAIPVK